MITAVADEDEVLHDMQRMVLERRLVELRKVPQGDRRGEQHAGGERTRGQRANRNTQRGCNSGRTTDAGAP